MFRVVIKVRGYVLVFLLHRDQMMKKMKMNHSYNTTGQLMIEFSFIICHLSKCLCCSCCAANDNSLFCAIFERHGSCHVICQQMLHDKNSYMCYISCINIFLILYLI